MDYLDVVVHVFTPEAREYYRLEQLWGEAPKRAVGDAEGRLVGGHLRAMELRGLEPLTFALPSATLFQLSYSPKSA